MPRSAGLPIAFALGLAAAACFSEAPSGGGADGTTGDACVLGSLGCPCAGEACDEGLACEPSVARCIDPTCTPGALLCTCVDGSCLQSLACQDGLCRSPDPGGTGGDVTGAGSLTTSPGPTSLPGDDGGPGGEVDATGPADTGDPTTGTMPMTEDGDPTMDGCQAMNCHDCRLCTIEVAGDCAMAWNVCSTESDCVGVQTCTFECTPEDTGCVQACCTTHGNLRGNLQYQSLASCAENACPGCAPDLSCPL